MRANPGPALVGLAAEGASLIWTKSSTCFWAPGIKSVDKIDEILLAIDRHILLRTGEQDLVLNRGGGRLAGDRRVEVTDSDGDTATLAARHAVVIATGSTSFPTISEVWLHLLEAYGL